jgi:dihydrofolate synthase/folylpolyglutamate synthase
MVLYGRDFHAHHGTTGTNLHFEGSKWSIEKVTPGLKGRFQLDNAACALAALESMVSAGMKISSQDAKKGIESARWPGRLQETGGFPPVIVDAAHNPAAVRALIDSLGEKKDTVWLISALSDKDLRGMAMEMTRISRRFVLVPLDHPRGMSVEKMEGEMPEGSDIKKVYNTRSGIEVARALAGKEGRVVSAGSVVLAGEVLEELRKTDQIEDCELRIED